MQNCPTCGAKVQPGFKSSILATPPMKAPRAQFSERTEHGVVVPFLQGGGSGAITGLIGAVASSLFWPTVEYAKVGLLAGLTTAGVVWGAALWDDRKRVWYKLEHTLGVDLNMDGFVGAPAPDGEPQKEQAPDVWVPYKENGRKAPHWKRYSIPWTDRREARMVARAVMGWGKSFSRRALVDMNIMPDDPEHYKHVYQAMIKDELLIKGSTRPTEKGELYLRGCLADIAPPAPGAE